MAAQQGFSTSPNMLAQLAAQLGGTAAVPAVQRSQYLADALQNLSHAGDGIKSYGALGANLLADVLLQYGRSRSNADLLRSIQGAQGNMLKASTAGTGLAGDGGAPPPPPITAPGTPDTSAPAAFAAPDAPAVAAPPPIQPGAPTSAKAQALAALIKGGLPPMGAAGLVGGFGQESGPDLSRSNPAEGAIGMANWEGPRAQAAQQFFAQNGGPSIANQAAFALSELHGPEARAMRALQAAQDPQAAAAAALQFERPAGWTPHGLPQSVSGWDARLAGAQELAPVAAGMAMPPAPDPQALAQGAPPAPMPPPSMPQGQPAPVQLAMLGGPQDMAGIAAPPPMPQGAPAAPVAPQQAPQAPQGIPTGADATPQEIALYRQYSQFPVGSAGWAKAMEIAQTVQARHAAPIELPKGEYFGPDGRARSVHMLQDVQGGSPNAFTQRDPVDNTLKITANPAYGPIGSGLAMNPQGAIGPVPGFTPRQLTTQQDRAAYGISPSDRAGYAVGPDGKPFVTAQDPFGPEHIATMRQDLSSNAQFNESREAAKAYQSMVELAKLPPGGMRAYALRDTFARVINPKGAVRLGTIQAIADTQGIPADIRGFLMNLKGDGPVPPEIVQQVLDASVPFARENYGIANSMNQDNAGFAQRHGIDPRDVTLDIGTPPTNFNLANWQAQHAANGQPGNPASGGSGGVPGGVPGPAVGGAGGRQAVGGVAIPTDPVARDALRRQIEAEIARRNGR